jgi:N-acyl-D-aspartate/D-glutamate deacylase
MRAWEFITEGKNPIDSEDGLTRVAMSLPNTFIIPSLKNQDFYELYRFGLAIAASRAENGQDDGVQNKFKHEFEAESLWGEHQVVSSFDPNIGDLIDQALKKVNKSGKKLVSTLTSDELIDTGTGSPMKPFKGYKK